MIPYTDFLYFGISLYALVPALLLGLLRRFWRSWIVIATLFMLAVQYFGASDGIAGPWNGLVLVIGYAILEWLVAIAWLRIRSRTPNRWVFYAAVLLGLLPLLGAKYAGLAGIEYPFAFIGLSYVTFSSLDVLIGIQDGVIKQLNPVRYLAFMLFFPAISSGPIDRYRRFSEDWERKRTPSNVLLDFDGGSPSHLHRIPVQVRAGGSDPAALDGSSRSAGGILQVLSYMYAYTLYLFFDFAGYSCFAVGFSYLLGIRTPENFDRPFLARDIRDFWNRWHMSLSSWFRDHIYNRFIFTALKGRWFRSPQLASSVGYLLTMGLMGLWHGTELHFLVYGLYHGVLLGVTSSLDRRFKANRLINSPVWSWHAASILLTFHLVAFGLLIFSGRLF